MKLIKIYRKIVSTVLILILWSTLFIIIAARLPVAEPELQDHEGNLALVVIQDWQDERDSYFASSRISGEIINSQTLFQTASVSKWLSTIGVLKFVADGKIELDSPVLHLIPQEFLPESVDPESFSAADIHLRMLMSHTAGLTDNLGYMGFTHGDTQTLRESLLYAEDAKEGASPVIRIGRKPGSMWQYSGGGFALLELLTESLSGESFDSYMRREILQPLGMLNARFIPPEGSIALHFDSDGNVHPHRTFAVASASSLYANTDDLTAFLSALQPGAALDQLIGPELRQEMMQNQAKIAGLNGYGLGVMQYRPFSRRDPVIGHDGNNWPGISTTVRIRPQNGAGIIVLSSGDPGLAADIASAWQQQETGWLDSLGLMKRLSSPSWIVSFMAVYVLLLFLRFAVVGSVIRLADRTSSV